jgi:hypothetical protein
MSDLRGMETQGSGVERMARMQRVPAEFDWMFVRRMIE